MIVAFFIAGSLVALMLASYEMSVESLGRVVEFLVWKYTYEYVADCMSSQFMMEASY